MFALVWVTLLFAAGLPMDKSKSCPDRICVTHIAEEITAEAGLCAVIPCSVQLDSSLTLHHIEWHKKTKLRYKLIIRSDHKTELREKVLMLQPNPPNCSIMINDLTESDSGSYQLRVYWVTGNSKQEVFTNPRATNLSVKALTQKPSMMIPTLTDGHYNTLTCTAPGLCSGSDPEFTWTWGRTGERNSPITFNITTYRVESVGPFTQRHNSSLIFRASATKHDGTEVTCKVIFANNITTEETMTLTVRSVPRISKDSTCEVRSKFLTCVCISRGFPLSVIIWPILRTLTRYSVSTTLTKQKVESTIIVSEKDHNGSVQCVSRNEVGQVQKDIDVIISAKEREGVQCGSSVLLPWAVAAVSLIVNVICIICVVILWNIRKKVEPLKEDRIYMTLDKTYPSQDYGVIGQPRS